MKDFGISVFLLFWSGASYGAPPPCSHENFVFTAPVVKSGEGKIEKQGCVLKFLTFLGQGEKLEVDVCNPEITITQYSTITESQGKNLHPGSDHCPLPLFGIDFNATEDGTEKFLSANARIQVILKDFKYHYKKAGKNAPSSALKATEAKLSCVETMLKTYLEECEAISIQKSQKSY